VAHLEALVEQVAGDASVPGPAAEGFSRRRMLRNGLGLSAAAVAGIGMLDAVGSSAAANDGDAVTIAATKSPSAAASAATRILNPSTSTHSPVLFQVDNTTNRTVAPPADTRAAIVATFAGNDDAPTQQSAVLGVAEVGTGVEGRSEAFRGVSGVTLGGAGVHGETTGFAGIGVEGVAEGGVGVSATATTGKAVVATSDSGEAIHATSTSNIAIVGNTVADFGVVGNAVTGTGVGANGATGVLAVGSGVGIDSSSAHGIAVKASSTDGTGVSSTSTSGTALSGTSGSAVGVSATSTSGVGARLQGGAAAVRLVPQGAAGHPTAGSHQRGELLVDARGKPWLCTKSGTPGTWRQLALV
jgi:hypothetical protein